MWQTLKFCEKIIKNWSCGKCGFPLKIQRSNLISQTEAAPLGINTDPVRRWICRLVMKEEKDDVCIQSLTDSKWTRLWRKNRQFQDVWDGNKAADLQERLQTSSSRRVHAADTHASHTRDLTADVCIVKLKVQLVSLRFNFIYEEVWIQRFSAKKLTKNNKFTLKTPKGKNSTIHNLFKVLWIFSLLHLKHLCPKQL